MIKGINKNIIEVTELDNVYYDKALFFIKPKYADAQRELLERETKKIIRAIGMPSNLKKKKKFLYWVLRLGSAAAIGSIVTAFILTI